MDSQEEALVRFSSVCDQGIGSTLELNRGCIVNAARLAVADAKLHFMQQVGSNQANTNPLLLADW